VSEHSSSVEKLVEALDNMPLRSFPRDLQNHIASRGSGNPSHSRPLLARVLLGSTRMRKPGGTNFRAYA